MKRINATTIPRLTKALFTRFHLTIFIVCIVAGLGYAVLSFSELLGDSATDTTYVSPIQSETIDQTTLDRLGDLHTSSENVPTLTTPPGRINPFTE